MEASFAGVALLSAVVFCTAFSSGEEDAVGSSAQALKHASEVSKRHRNSIFMESI